MAGRLYSSQVESTLNLVSSRTRRRLSRAALTEALLALAPCYLGAQHAHHPPGGADSTHSAITDTAMTAGGGHDMASMMDGPLGVSHVRMGSGTSWMPDSSPMHANHKMWGDWTVMLHGVAFAQYDKQWSRRGDDQLGIVDWEMVMAMRRVGSGMLHLHGMASLEPATIGAKGYPLLLQTGESHRGAPLHDRQHPHDALMEIAAMFQQPVGRNVALELYGGLAGEPALGPVAFMHRPSAQNDPLSPLGHHWQDATHISYGVLTAGIYSRWAKLEGSLFNGREPDENRWNLDLRRLDAYSGRLTVNPTDRLSVAGWYGFLPSPEALHPDESVHRYGASMLYGGRGIAGGAWESMLLWGANAHGGRTETSLAAESNLEIGQRNAVFGRAEYVKKSAEELVLPNVDEQREFPIRSLVGGYMREVGKVRGGSIGVGGRLSVNFVPSDLRPFYGTQTPSGLAVYVRIRPNRMESADSRAMSGMPEMREMPGMQRGDSAHTMPMPVAMPMRADSTMRADSSDMHHDPMPHDSGGMRMRPPGSPARDSASVMLHDSTMQHMAPRNGGVRADTSASADSAGTARRPPPHDTPTKAAAERTPAKKTPAKKTPAPSSHTGHDMPGMSMPPDTTHRHKP